MSYSQVNPGHGNLPEISVFKVGQDERVTSTAEVSASLSAILNSEAAMSWQSASAMAWRERLGRVFPMLDAAAQVAWPWSNASKAYHSSLEQITANANAEFTSSSMAQTMLTAYSHVPYAVTSTPEFQVKIRAYEDDISQGYRRLSDLQTMRDEADATCKSQLSYYSPLGEQSKWAALQALYGDASSVADIRGARMALVTEYTELATKIAHGEASDEEVAQFTEFMSKTTSDPILASEFWLRVGGEDTRLLLTGLGETVSPGDLEELEALQVAASAIRESISVGSACWTESEASAFAAGLLEDVTQMSGLDAISYLFNDPANSPMGEGLTVATANILDEWERGPQGFGPGAVLVDRPALTPLGQTMFLENDGLGDWKTTGNDPMARVFATLGRYPDAALDWLTDGSTDPVWDASWSDGSSAPTTGNARIDYWFGERAWESDGMAGVGALWEGSMHAHGGLMDGPPNTATWDAQCDTNAKVISALAAGMSGLRPGDMSEGAANALGGALAHLMPMASVSLWSQAEPQPAGLLLDVDRNVPGFDGTMTIPFFNHGELGELMGQVGSTEMGFAALRVATLEVENRLFAEAEVDGSYGTWQVNIDRIYTLEANFDGSVGGASVVQGRFDDEILRGKIGVLSDLVGLIPGVKIEGLAGTVVGIADGGARSGLVGSFEQSVVINESLAINLVDSEVILGRVLLDSQLSRLEADPTSSLGAVDMPKNVTAKEWLNQYGTDYQATYDARLWRATA